MQNPGITYKRCSDGSPTDKELDQEHPARMHAREVMHHQPKRCWKAFYLDFSKAFVKVPHNSLTAKLTAKGISEEITTCIDTWLN